MKHKKKLKIIIISAIIFIHDTPINIKYEKIIRAPFIINAHNLTRKSFFLIIIILKGVFIYFY